MIHRTFKEQELSLLGFGTMRLPLKEDGTIDEQQVQQMVDYSMSHGVNYFDTAYPYHNGASERVIGKALRKYPRDSYYLATKYPGHQISKSYDPAAIFENQLNKCSVDYFDYYLLHNVYEKSIETYLYPKWGILDYFIEQKRLGRIKHLGFSCHGGLKLLEEFLDICGDKMEFCQIQLNYLDWTLQEGKEKYELLTKRNIPVWVMEPVRGGKLCTLPKEREAVMKELRPEESIPAWGFRFLQDLPNVKMILSGMSNMEQMIDNVKTFTKPAPLSTNEVQLLLDIAEDMKDSIPCTGCRYCCDGCPMGLDIPFLLSSYNEIRFSPTVMSSMRVEGLPEHKKPEMCIDCGKCSTICPQNIDIPKALKNMVAAMENIITWEELCRQREAAQK